MARQRATVRELAGRLGLRVVTEHTDNDIGASTRSTKPRPGYAELLRRAAGSEFVTVLAYSSSRLTRRPREHEDLIELAERFGTRFAYVVSPSFDLNTADGRNVARILASNDAAEAERTGERVADAALARARAGGDNGGPRRYGLPCSCPGPHPVQRYRPDGTVEVRQHVHEPLHLIAEEARVVAQLCARVVTGESTRGLAAWLRQTGVPTARGGTWSARVVKEIIVRPSNAGYREYRGELLTGDDGAPLAARCGFCGRPANTESAGCAAHGPLVDPEVWAAAVAILTSPERGSWYGQTPQSLLAGIARCWCGGPVKSGARATYAGAACNHFKRARAKVDAVVVAFVLAFLEREGIGAATARPVVDNTARIAAVRRQLDLLEDRLADEDLTPAAYRRQRARKAAQLAELEREQAVAIVPGPLEGITPETWAAGLPLERQRAVVEFLAEVILVRAGTPDSHNGVQIIPRQGDRR